MSKWKDVDHQLPEEQKMVIGYCKPIYGDSYVTAVHYCNHEWYEKGKTVSVSQQR